MLLSLRPSRPGLCSLGTKNSKRQPRPAPPGPAPPSSVLLSTRFLSFSATRCVSGHLGSHLCLPQLSQASPYGRFMVAPSSLSFIAHLHPLEREIGGTLVVTKAVWLRMGSSNGAREGDWRCDGCGNRNYAFRSFCNRCKIPRLLVDSKTPSDSKWLPRIGDWICAGCSNNNYASREKCNKCSKPKECAALPAMALPGSAMAAPPSAVGLNTGPLMPTMPLHHSQPDWNLGNTNLGGSLPDTGSWRPGDWICTCGYPNYSYFTTCKHCQAPSSAHISGNMLMQVAVQTGLGTKRLLPDDFGAEYANKRLNTGSDLASVFQNQSNFFSSISGLGTSIGYANPTTAPTSSWSQPAAQPAPLNLVPAIVGKGAKQWRSGDWMCAGCNNHNYASRAMCNRCGGSKETMTQVLPVA